MKKLLILPVIVFLAVSCKPAIQQEPVPQNNQSQPSTNNNPVSATPTSGKIDEHLTIDETLKDVNFCGEMYKVKQIKVDGVDVIQRIAYLATNNLIPTKFAWDEKDATHQPGALAKQICENVGLHDVHGVIQASVGGIFSGKDMGLDNETIYTFNFGETGEVALPSGRLFIESGFSGTPTGPIGTLK
jgi:hypothetical protein